jgi:predicted nuclease of predicted toxin-antitoxin system
MGVGRTMVQWLRDQGHDATRLLDEGLERLPDPEVLEKATREGRILLTTDLDFGEIVATAPSAKASVIIFRLRRGRQRHAIERLSRCLAAIGPREVRPGTIVVIDDTRIRVRHWPQDEV